MNNVTEISPPLIDCWNPEVKLKTLGQTRKTQVFYSESFPFALKIPIAFIDEHPKNENEAFEKFFQKRYSASFAYNEIEKKKQEIAFSYVQHIPNLNLPLERFFIAKAADGFPFPYRVQEFQQGKQFSAIPNFWSVITNEHIHTLIQILESDLQYYHDHNHHLDIIGFSCDHVPSEEEIEKAYQDPFPVSTNLILNSQGTISWVDIKTSNPDERKNIIRARLLEKELHRLQRIES